MAAMVNEHIFIEERSRADRVTGREAVGTGHFDDLVVHAYDAKS